MWSYNPVLGCCTAAAVKNPLLTSTQGLYLWFFFFIFAPFSDFVPFQNEQLLIFKPCTHQRKHYDSYVITILWWYRNRGSQICTPDSQYRLIKSPFSDYCWSLKSLPNSIRAQRCLFAVNYLAQNCIKVCNMGIITTTFW